MMKPTKIFSKNVFSDDELFLLSIFLLIIGLFGYFACAGDYELIRYIIPW